VAENCCGNYKGAAAFHPRGGSGRTRSYGKTERRNGPIGIAIAADPMRSGPPVGASQTIRCSRIIKRQASRPITDLTERKLATTTKSQIVKLPQRQASAIKRRAQDLGLTPQKYLQQLIEDDLAVSDKARSTALDELAAPFREALAGVSEEELDRRVKAARAGRRSARRR
jgi:predicted DNA binding CopG/RHH family protein